MEEGTEWAIKQPREEPRGRAEAVHPRCTPGETLGAALCGSSAAAVTARVPAFLKRKRVTYHQRKEEQLQTHSILEKNHF